MTFWAYSKLFQKSGCSISRSDLSNSALNLARSKRVTDFFECFRKRRNHPPDTIQLYHRLTPFLHIPCAARFGAQSVYFMILCRRNMHRRTGLPLFYQKIDRRATLMRNFLHRLIWFRNAVAWKFPVILFFFLSLQAAVFGFWNALSPALNTERFLLPLALLGLSTK